MNHHFYIFIIAIGAILLVASLISMFNTRHGFSTAQHVADLEKLLADQLAERADLDVAINATSRKLMRAMEQQDQTNKEKLLRAIDRRWMDIKTQAAAQGESASQNGGGK